MDSQAIHALREQFVELCVASVPPVDRVRNERREHAPAEFLALCQHPAIKKILINGQCLFVRTRLVQVQGVKLGVYNVGINPHARQYGICNTVHVIPYRAYHTSLSFLHHPHASGQSRDGATFCMAGVDLEWKNICASGALGPAMRFLLNVLCQVNDAKAYGDGKLAAWRERAEALEKENPNAFRD